MSSRLVIGVTCIGSKSVHGQFCSGGGVNKAAASLLLVRSSSSTTNSNRGTTITSNTVPTFRSNTTTRIIHSFSSSAISKDATATTNTAFPSSASNHQQHQTFLYPDDNAVNIHARGDLPYGSREYLLLPPHVKIKDLVYEPSLLIASIRAHRNILFDARINIMTSSSSLSSTTTTNDKNIVHVHDSVDDDDDDGHSPVVMIKQQDQRQQYTPRLVHVCLPLVQAALQDAGCQGEQPQAVSTLHGLSSWVVDCLEGKIESQVLKNLLTQSQQQQNITTTASDNDKSASTSTTAAAAAAAADIALGAVRAIATGIPRPGHSIVGIGTYRDAQITWQALAKEYVQLTTITTAKTKASTSTQQNYHYGSQEAELYQAGGGQLVSIEYLADQQPTYLKSAGGAMARFFFL